MGKPIEGLRNDFPFTVTCCLCKLPFGPLEGESICCDCYWAMIPTKIKSKGAVIMYSTPTGNQTFYDAYCKAGAQPHQAMNNTEINKGD